ncbi:MAG: SGNH/GDSL hydrolase family protein [Lysobacterales bacterium]
MFQALLHVSVFWLCFPLVLAQALWLRRSTETLPGAPGPGLGQTRSPVSFRILGLGDSIIDGVGTEHRSESLTAQLAEAVSTRLNSDKGGVSWHAVGRSGYTASKVADRLLTELAPEPYDLIVISVGVNDVTGLVSLVKFGQDLERLAEGVEKHSPDAQVILLGVPPMWQFPRLPQPLRWVIGQRAKAFQHAGQYLASSLNWDFLATQIDTQPENFAEDGYHPNAQSIVLWAKEIARAVRINELLA